MFYSASKLANLISKLNLFKLIPYPMDNYFTGRRDWSCQMTEKAVLYKLLAGPVTDYAFARYSPCTSFLSRQRDIIASFLLSSPLKTPRKLIAGPDGRALPVHWVGH